MIQAIRSAARGVAVCAAVAALTACENEVPTAIGSDLFPGGESPTTLVAEFGGSDLVLGEQVLAGFGDPRLAPFLIVANQYEGALDANALARFDTFPDSISYNDAGTPRRAEIASFPSGRILVDVDSIASLPVAPTGFELYELTQAWDSATVSWEYAVDRPGEQVPWTRPGGTRGFVMSVDAWLPAEPDSAMGDTLVFVLDSVEVARLQAEDHPGVLLTTSRTGARIKLSGLTFAADARPAGDPDTLIEVRTTMNAAQTFIFSPPVPDNPDVLVTGGLRGDRSIVTLDLEQEVEACPADGGACTVVPLQDVTVNRAQLVLKAVPVPGGHGPIAIPRVVLRQVSEPALGRFAPLGAVIAADSISPSRLAAGDEFVIDLTGAVLQYLAQKRRAENDPAVEAPDPERSFALLTEFAVADMGLIWFERSPRLRIIYTLPLNPSLP